MAPTDPANLDSDGQPFALPFNAARRREREISELLGLAKGLLADGVVSTEEAQLLSEWVAVHHEARSVWPCSVIAARLSKIYEDGVATDAERADLAKLLSDLVGERTGIVCGMDTATRLPLDVPPPDVTFFGNVFVLTGKFAMGSRAECERLTTGSGGMCESTVTRRTRYLVIGTFGSRDWIHTSHGRKIEKAVHYRETGQHLAIIGEDHWADAIPSSV